MLTSLGLLVTTQGLSAPTKPAFVEMMPIGGGSIGAIFLSDWMLRGAVASPIVMLLIWVMKEWWDEHKGWKKDLKDDIKWLRENVTAVKIQVGDDLDEKIEKKVKHAFELYSHGRRS